MPVGPRGEQGASGKDGLSAYELWVKAVSDKTIDYSGPTDISHFFLYLKGKDGADGKDGRDGANGKSAYEMWKEYVASGVDDPHNPGTKWDVTRVSIADFYWFLTGNNGADGHVPYIKDGNWWIGDKDTGVKAKGEAGADGKNGVDGQGAYEMWVTYVKETIASGGKVIDQNGNEITLSDLSIQKFFQYLTGKAGQKGDKGADGKDGVDGRDGQDGRDGVDGKDGKDGLTPEIDPKTGEWIIIDRETRDTIFTHVPARGRDGKDGSDGADGKDGADGQDGSTPYIGDNGNWWINGEDTGVKAQGPKGDTGADGKDGTDGKDGVDGKSAYELWIEEVTSEEGLEDPKNPGAKWDPSRTTLEDFFEYLRGAAGADGGEGSDGKDGEDGKDGSNGKSAYELWKELVLSEEGLDNPDNGVYDITEYPKWPRTAVSINDFYEYLRGRDGRDGNDGKDGDSGEDVAPTDTSYVDEADWGKYNVVPVRALAKVKERYSMRDTTYEYANPYTGGCFLAVTAPGPIMLPNCTVSFKDQAGNSYTRTSDESGYIYMKREELPVWKEGSPRISDLTYRTKPDSFVFDDRQVTDPDMIASTCGVPYQVEVVTEMLDSWWKDYHVFATYRISRIVEGEKELSWGDQIFPSSSDDGLGYFYYRNAGDMSKLRNLLLDSYSQLDYYCLGNHFIRLKNDDVQREWSRSRGTVASVATKNVIYGNGTYPQTIDIHYLPVRERGGQFTYDDYVPDYGMESVSEEKTIIPEYCSIGSLDVKAKKGGSGDEPYTSFNGKLVMSDDGASKVLVNNTNYELILGQTSFSFSLDYSTFGHVYMRQSYYDESSKTFRFKRYDTLLDYLEDTGETATQREVMIFENSGMLGDVSINNKVSVYFTVRDGKISEEIDRSFIIRNVYDKFTVKFQNFDFEDVFYEGLDGTFSYSEEDPYVASCTLGKSRYTFQAIKDAKSAPLP